MHECTCLAASVMAAFVASLVALVEGSMTWWGTKRLEMRVMEVRLCD